MRLIDNDPLTLEELRQMDGEPVWVHIAGSLRGLVDADGVWGLVDADDSVVCFNLGEGIDFSEIAGLVYRNVNWNDAPCRKCFAGDMDCWEWRGPQAKREG